MASIDKDTLRLEAMAYRCRSLHNAAVGKYVRQPDDAVYDAINECLRQALYCIKSIAVTQEHCPDPWCDDGNECQPCDRKPDDQQ